MGIEYSIFSAKLLKYISNPIRIVSHLSFSFPIFLGWSALYFGIKSWRDWLQEKDQTEQAIEEAQHAQLQMLRYQLNPHFLFNALNSVRALVDEDARKAKTLITDLSEFLRYSLMSRNKPTVTLKEEVEAIRLYLAVEQIRYEDKLQVDFDIDPRTEEIPVPSFLVHPIVEYALRSGMQNSALPVCIKISSQLIDSVLRISVLHSGYNHAVKSDGTLEVDLEQVKAHLGELLQNKYNLFSLEEDNHTKTVLEMSITNGVANEEKAAGYYSRR